MERVSNMTVCLQQNLTPFRCSALRFQKLTSKPNSKKAGECASGCVRNSRRIRSLFHGPVFTDKITVLHLVKKSPPPNHPNLWKHKFQYCEIMWNANLMQQGNFIHVFLALHVSAAYATSSGALDAELQHMVFCTEFVGGWWSWEPLRKLCVWCGRTIHTTYAAAYAPETCRAKNTSIKLPCCIKLAFTLFHEEDARSNNPHVFSTVFRPARHLSLSFVK